MVRENYTTRAQLFAHQPTRAHLREPFRESTPVCESPSAYKMYQPVSQPASQSISEGVSQSVSQPASQPVNQSINQSLRVWVRVHTCVSNLAQAQLDSRHISSYGNAVILQR